MTLLLVVSAGFVWRQRANDLQIHLQSSEHLVRLHTEIILNEYRTAESELAFLAEQSILRRFAGGDQDLRADLEQEYVRFCRNKSMYDQVRFLDREGAESIRINNRQGDPQAVPPERLQSKANRYYFVNANGLPRGSIFVSPLDLNVEYDVIEVPYKPVVRFAAPVFDLNDQRQGVLVINLLGRGLLNTLAIAAQGYPGSAWLLNRDGDFLRGPDPNREWGFMTGKRFAIQQLHPLVWNRLQASASGQFVHANGVFTFRNLPPTGDSPANSVPRDTPAASPDISDPSPGDSTLRIVSFIPTSVVYANSDQLAMRLLLLSILVSIPLALLAWYFARLGMLRRQHEMQIAQSETRLRVLSRRLLTAQEDERRRLSRDLHDELGQQVTAVTLDLQQVAKPSAATRSGELIARALQGSLAILDRIHELSTRVRPAMLDDLGLRDAVRDLAHDLAARSGFELRLELRLDGPDPDSQTGTAVYRIIQEALTNVARHAQAKHVTIDMLSDDRRIKIAITDDGIGFDIAAAATADRLGLLGMRERAELLGGRFVIQSTPGSGTRIAVELPLHATEADCDQTETGP